MLKQLKHLAWCCTRVAVAVEVWPFMWWFGLIWERDENRDSYSLHLGPVTVKILCRFWIDGEEQPQGDRGLGYFPGL